MPKHAFLGMGIMGASMAANLGRSGLVTNVWNRTTTSPGIQIAKRAGCNVVKIIEEAVNNVDFIFTCVSDAPDVEKVLFSSGGVVENAKKGALIIDFSTIGSKAAKSFGHRLKQIGLRFLDAPVS